MDFYKRCCYHLAVGLLISTSWLLFAQPVGLCGWPGNTGAYWFGMFLVLLQLLARAASFVQKNLQRTLRSEDGIPSWCRLSTPYFAEVFFYSGTALLLTIGGGPDTLTTLRAREAAQDLFLLSFLCLGLLPIGSLVLGGRLSNSKLPAWLPILSGGFFCVVSITASFDLNEELMPGSFPLLQVCVVAISALLFLWFCCRTPKWWLCSRKPPHPAMALACLLPVLLPFLFALLCLETGLLAAMACFLLGVAVVVLAASPVYLLTWLLPWRPRGGALVLWCGVQGVFVFYNMLWIGCVIFNLERAPWMPSPGWHLFLGGFSVVAPCCISDRKERCYELEQSGPEGIVESAPKRFSCEL